MKLIKHILVDHLWAWITHAARDAKAWISGIATVVGGAILDNLQAGAADITSAFSWTAHQWAAYLAKVGIPALLAFFLAGRPHQTAAEIQAKLDTLKPPAA
jgi:hypothetical protein